jgi:predicted patatin/cPLA2 family phospholipase
MTCLRISSTLVFASIILLGQVAAFQTTSSFTSTYTNRFNSFSKRTAIASPVQLQSSTSLSAKEKSKTSEATIPEEKYEVTSVQELEDYFNDKEHRFRKKNGDIDYDTLLAKLSVKGDTQKLGSTTDRDFVHPVLQLLHDRRRNNSPLTKTSEVRPDGRKVALVVEGGGMRGCITAGMVTALHYLGLEDTVDVIYGSSAGTIIGAYFNTRQLPWFGPELYYDSLTTSGKQFIDSKRLLRTLGLGLLDPRLLKDVVTRPGHGKPVVNLDFLMKTTVQEKKPLDWEKFVEMQKVQPLKVVASGLKSEKSVTYEMSNGGFSSLEEFTAAAHGSCLLPGIAGPVMNHDANGGDEKFFVKNNVNRPGVEPLSDALIFEPLPYQTAIDEGATDVVVLRSRPDGVDVTGKTSIFEKLIFRRFFKRKNKLDHIYRYMRQHQQKKIYAKLVLELNDATKAKGDKQMMAIAVPPGSKEVTRLEKRREEIFDGVRRGFARAYDALVEDPNERGRGAEVAKQVLPDEILDYDPLEINSGGMSAFEYYLKEKDANGDGDDLPNICGMTAAQAGLPR